MIVERALAKVNLALHVLGRRGDGYHLLDSVVGFADVADVITIEPASRDHLAVTGPFAGGVPTDNSNLVLKALAALREVVSLAPITIKLEKNLPIAGGIGGGSSDAAAMIRACLRLSSQGIAPDQINAVALSLGADVPVCLQQQISRMSGIGEVVELLASPPAAAIVLVNPGVGCLTTRVFSQLNLARDSQFRGPVDLLNPSQWRNDLYEPAIVVQPIIADVLLAMDATKTFSVVRMSGSGATCFGLAASLDDAQEVAKQLQQLYPQWWVKAAKLQ